MSNLKLYERIDAAKSAKKKAKNCPPELILGSYGQAKYFQHEYDLAGWMQPHYYHNDYFRAGMLAMDQMVLLQFLAPILAFETAFAATDKLQLAKTLNDFFLEQHDEDIKTEIDYVLTTFHHGRGKVEQQLKEEIKAENILRAIKEDTTEETQRINTWAKLNLKHYILLQHITQDEVMYNTYIDLLRAEIQGKHTIASLSEELFLEKHADLQTAASNSVNEYVRHFSYGFKDIDPKTGLPRDLTFLSKYEYAMCHSYTVLVYGSITFLWIGTLIPPIPLISMLAARQRLSHFYAQVLHDLGLSSLRHTFTSPELFGLTVLFMTILTVAAVLVHAMAYQATHAYAENQDHTTARQNAHAYVTKKAAFLYENATAHPEFIQNQEKLKALRAENKSVIQQSSTPTTTPV